MSGDSTTHQMASSIDNDTICASTLPDSADHWHVLETSDQETSLFEFDISITKNGTLGVVMRGSTRPELAKGGLRRLYDAEQIRLRKGLFTEVRKSGAVFQPTGMSSNPREGTDRSSVEQKRQVIKIVRRLGNLGRSRLYFEDDLLIDGTRDMTTSDADQATTIYNFDVRPIKADGNLGVWIKSDREMSANELKAMQKERNRIQTFLGRARQKSRENISGAPETHAVQSWVASIKPSKTGEFISCLHYGGEQMWVGQPPLGSPEVDSVEKKHQVIEHVQRLGDLSTYNFSAYVIEDGGSVGLKTMFNGKMSKTEATAQLAEKRRIQSGLRRFQEKSDEKLLKIPATEEAKSAQKQLLQSWVANLRPPKTGDLSSCLHYDGKQMWVGKPPLDSGNADSRSDAAELADLVPCSSTSTTMPNDDEHFTAYPSMADPRMSFADSEPWQGSVAGTSFGTSGYAFAPRGANNQYTPHSDYNTIGFSPSSGGWPPSPHQHGHDLQMALEPLDPLLYEDLGLSPYSTGPGGFGHPQGQSPWNEEEVSSDMAGPSQAAGEPGEVYDAQMGEHMSSAASQATPPDDQLDQVMLDPYFGVQHQFYQDEE